MNYIAKELVKGDGEWAEEIGEDIQGLCEVETSPTTIINDINRKIDIKSQEQIYEITELIVSLSNHTRLWSNNGYTPNELFEISEKQHLRPLPDDNSMFLSQKSTYNKEKKIVRNDPCPCGSRKKYKKCCL